MFLTFLKFYIVYFLHCIIETLWFQGDDTYFSTPPHTHTHTQTSKHKHPDPTSVSLVAGHFGLDLSPLCFCLSPCVWLALCEEQPSVWEESLSFGWLFVRTKTPPAFVPLPVRKFSTEMSVELKCTSYAYFCFEFRPDNVII